MVISVSAESRMVDTAMSLLQHASSSAVVRMGSCAGACTAIACTASSRDERKQQ